MCPRRPRARAPARARRSASSASGRSARSRSRSPGSTRRGRSSRRRPCRRAGAGRPPRRGRDRARRRAGCDRGDAACVGGGLDLVVETAGAVAAVGSPPSRSPWRARRASRHRRRGRGRRAPRRPDGVRRHGRDQGLLLLDLGLDRASSAWSARARGARPDRHAPVSRRPLRGSVRADGHHDGWSPRCCSSTSSDVRGSAGGRGSRREGVVGEAGSRALDPDLASPPRRPPRLAPGSRPRRCRARPIVSRAISSVQVKLARNTARNVPPR